MGLGCPVWVLWVPAIGLGVPWKWAQFLICFFVLLDYILESFFIANIDFHQIKSSPLHFNEKTWKGGIMWAGLTSQKVGLPLKMSNFWVLISTCAQCNFFFAINWKNWNWLSSNWKQLRNFWIFIFTCAFAICCLSKICIKDLHQRFASRICFKNLYQRFVSKICIKDLYQRFV